MTYGFKEKHDFHNILRKIDKEFGYEEYFLWGRSFGAVVAMIYAQSFLHPKNFPVADSVDLKKGRGKKKKKKKGGFSGFEFSEFIIFSFLEY